MFNFLHACAADKYASDTYTTRNGSSVKFMFFGHASIALETNGKYIYVDPVSMYANYSTLPKADVILITHSHTDHLDAKAIDNLSKETTSIICDSLSYDKIHKGHAVKPGDNLTLLDEIPTEVISAYNLTPGHLQFHPKENKNCGFILTIGDSRIYIAGDSENTTEMKSLKDIDVAFLPVNQPYTMIVDEAVDAIKSIRPKIFYPYHYGGTDVKTDMNRLSKEAGAYTEVRIRPLE